MIILAVAILIILLYYSYKVKLHEKFSNNNNKNNKAKNLFFVISKKVTYNMYSTYSNIIKNDIIFITDSLEM